ncbi:MAG: class I SAM-dependent methyltransferase [Candidatus Andersenbacteria bacterium]
MPRFHRKLILDGLTALRGTSARKPVLRLLVWLHNTSYHQISFFASHTGIHPKHAIQNYYRFFLEHIDPTDRVLDVGSGNGAVAYKLAEKAKVVAGIDIRPANVAHAKKTYQRDNLEFLVGDATTYSFQEPFDVIVLSNVLEHIEHRIEFLQKLQHVAPKILIRVPMLTRDWITVYKKEQGLPYRLDDTHFIEYTTEVFRREMKEAGLKIEHLHVNFGELYAVVRKDQK